MAKRGRRVVLFAQWGVVCHERLGVMKSEELVEGIAGNRALPRGLTTTAGQLVQIRIRHRAFEALLRSLEDDLRVNVQL